MRAQAQEELFVLRMLGQQGFAMLALLVYGFQGFIQITALLLKHQPVFVENGQIMLQLGNRLAGAVIHIDQAQNFGQLEAQTFSAQGQLQAGPVTGVVDAIAAIASRADDALVLVEPDGTRSYRELLCQFRDGPGGFGHDQLPFTLT